MKHIRKLFGGLEMTWLKVIIFAVVSGVYTGIMAMLPFTENTSFRDIAASFEWWILFAIIIIVNCKKPFEATCKTFVFFLLSQPIVYLVQVPFSWLGWGIFRYYPSWFMWTLLTIPMAFVGWFVTKRKWYSLLILSPMLLILGSTGSSYFHDVYYDMPHHLLTVIFCIVQMFVLVLFIFDKTWIRIAGCIANVAILAVFFFITMKDMCYMDSTSTYDLDPSHSYSITADDPSIADVEVLNNGQYVQIHTRILKKGETTLHLTDETTGEVFVYNVQCGDDTALSIREAE